MTGNTLIDILEDDIMDGTSNIGEWSEWRQHVLSEIVRLNTNLERVNEQQITSRLDIRMLKLQAAAWGSAGGAAVYMLVTRLLAGG